MIKNIVLIGFMGSGKTTVGKMLAQELGYDFIDTDHLVETNEEMQISKIFDAKGETYFRQAENAALKEAMSLTGRIVSTGGGIVTVGDNGDILSKGLVVYLQASPRQIYKRLKGDKTRPLLQEEDVYATISSMLKERERLYKKAAHYTIQVDGKMPQAICNLIIEEIK